MEDMTLSLTTDQGQQLADEAELYLAKREFLVDRATAVLVTGSEQLLWQQSRGWGQS